MDSSSTNSSETSFTVVSHSWHQFSVFLLAIILSIVAGIVFPVQYSAYAFALGKLTVAFGFFWVVDTFFLTESDTMAELKKGNIAYAIALLGYFIVCASALLSV